MTLQFALTARFRRATSPFGIDVIYRFHRWMAVGALALACGHYLILRFGDSAWAVSLDPLRPSWTTSTGYGALAGFVVLTVASLWRKALRLEYDRWRSLHAVVAVAAMVSLVIHLVAADGYAGSAVGRAMLSAYTILWVGLITYVRVIKPMRLRRRPYRVTGVGKECDKTWTVVLVPDGHSGLRFQPGQFAWLTFARSPFRAREHPFSFAGSAEADAELRFTVKELGDFTSRIGLIETGETAYVDGPHGTFTMDRYPTAAGFVFIAGGVGIAPIISMLRTLADRGDGRPHTLVYSNHALEDIVFYEELATLTRRLDLDVVHVLERPPADWDGERGIVDTALLGRVLPADRAGVEYFLCGPEPMSRSVERSLRQLGAPLRAIHFELFEMA